MNNDLFRLIIRQCSLLPLGGDLLSSLSGTPAGEQLQKILITTIMSMKKTAI
jgi:hypothetical protein